MPLVKQNRRGGVIQACEAGEDEGMFRRPLTLLPRATEGITLVSWLRVNRQ